MYVAMVLHAAIHTLYFTLLRYSLWSSSLPLVSLGILRYTQITRGISRHPFFLDTSLSISLARSLHDRVGKALYEIHCCFAVRHRHGFGLQVPYVCRLEVG
jgi:hypothetical protein